MKDSLSIRKKESYKIFDEIAGSYDFLNKFLSMGIDKYWRRKLLQNLPKKEQMEALDLACGTGDVSLALAENKQIKRVTGLDLSKEMILLGQKKVARKKFSKKIQLKIGDATKLDYQDQTIDLVTISFGIRNFDNPDQSLREIERILTPGGKLLIAELTIPKNALIKKVYFFYFRFILPTIGNLLSGHTDAYTYLNQTVEDFPAGSQFQQKMIKAGLIKTKFTPLTFGISTIYEGEKSA